MKSKHCDCGDKFIFELLKYRLSTDKQLIGYVNAWQQNNLLEKDLIKLIAKHMMLDEKAVKSNLPKVLLFS